MAVIQQGIIPAKVYNTLPNIRSRFDVPESNAVDIADLKELLNRYDLSDKVRIKLIHIHFFLNDGEVFAARRIEVPKYGAITIMQPLVAAEQGSLFGYHYYVDDAGNLSAYEYMQEPGPDLSGQEAFIREFCQLVRDRGLQRKLGLSLRHSEDKSSTRELEYPAQRTCIDVPFNISLPLSEDSHETMTEFLRDWPADDIGEDEIAEPRQRVTHKHHRHHTHPKPPKRQEADSSDSGTISDEDFSDDEGVNGLTVSYGLPREIDLAGHKLETSSDLYGLVSFIADGVEK